MIGRAIGGGFVAARDFLARGLVRIGATPNTLTLAGLAKHTCLTIAQTPRLSDLRIVLFRSTMMRYLAPMSTILFSR